MRTNSNRFKINLVTLAVASALTAWGMSHVQAQTSVGGCDTYTPTQGQTVTCTIAGTNPGSIGIQVPTNTSVNNVTVNIQPGVVLNVNGSTVGLGNTSTVTNAGTLNTRAFFNGYGISSGVNGRSGGGGNIFINDSTGSIITAGGNAAGMFINATLAGSAGNSITNLGAITTSGADADGIRLISNSNQTVTNIITNSGSGSIQTSGSNAHGVSLTNLNNVIQITNAGSIVVTGTGSYGIYSKGAINLTVEGTISSANGVAIYLDSSTTNTAANTVTVQSGANIVGSIAFDTGKLSEKLIFDGIAVSGFNNVITGLNDIEVINSGDVRMTAASYDFGDSEIAIESGSVLTIAGNVSGAGSLTKTGMGELALSGSNTYSGNTVVAEGVLAVLSDNALGSGKLIIGSFRQNPGTQAVLSTGISVSNAIQMGQAVSPTDIAVISSYGGNNVLSGDIELQSSAQIFTDVLTENRLTISGAIDATTGGTQYLEADGADGKLVLSGGIGQNNPLGSVLLEGLVQLSSNITTIGSQYLDKIALSSDVVLRGGEVFLTGSLNGNHNLEIIADTSVGLASVGASSAISGIEITSAQIELSDVSSTGNQIYRATAGSTSDIQTNSTYTSAGGDITFDGAVQANDGLVINTTVSGAAGGVVTFESILNSEANESNDVMITAGSGLINFNGVVGTTSLLGSLTINSGVVNINGGRVSTAGAQIYADDVNIGAATILVVNGLSAQNVNVNGHVLTIDESGEGVVQGSINGSRGVVKAGPGVLTLNGVNTQRGLRVAQGTVALGQSASVGLGDVDLRDGSTLQANADLQIRRDVDLTGSVTINTHGYAIEITGPVSGTGSLVKAGSGTLILNNSFAANGYSGGTVLSAGSLEVIQSGAAGTGTITIGNANLQAGADGLNIGNDIVLQSTASQVATGDFDTTLSGEISGAGGLTKSGSGTLTLVNASNSYSGGSTVSSGALSLLDNTAAGSGQIAIDDAALKAGADALNIANDIALNSSNSRVDTGSFATTLSGLVSGSGQLVKTGSGVLTLSGANTYTGGTTISAGTLVLAQSDSAGTGRIALSFGTTLQANAAMTLANAISVAGNSTLATGANAVTASGVVSGSGRLIKTGAGALTLSSVNTYSGGTELQGGTIVAASDTALGTGVLESAGSGVVLQAGKANLTLANAVTLSSDLIVDTAGELVLLNGDVTGAGRLIKRGTGILELAGNNTYAGGTTVEAGTLALDLNSATSSGEVIMAADTVVQADTTLALDNVFKLRGPVEFNTQGFDLTLNNTISNNSVGQLIKTGAGTLTLNGANDYSGGTIVQQGTLALFATLASGVDVQSGTTFGGTGTVTGEVSNAGTIIPRLN
ncbi:MAG: autotransporter-associated beta strand repeat-containing protein, partial [Burkholderiaceae bacterium]|nr:autotransporter-associated beta strand repeat-containing protein [Burkholderiaceae bacterium]